jgi:hypothetical protein
MKPVQSALLFTGALAVLGYIGAAIFYGYLLGFNTQTPFVCPICPHVTAAGEPSHKFLVRTLFLGTLNALLLASIGWCLRWLVLIAKRAIRH